VAHGQLNLSVLTGSHVRAVRQTIIKTDGDEAALYKTRRVKIVIESLWSRRLNGRGGGPSMRDLLSPWVKALNLSDLDSGRAAITDSRDVSRELVVVEAPGGGEVRCSISLGRPVVLNGFC
jgi:hypothetical protein